jgi:hypothetical protein
MLYSEIIAVCSQIHTEHIIHCGQNVEFLNVKTGGSYSYLLDFLTLFHYGISKDRFCRRKLGASAPSNCTKSTGRRATRSQQSYKEAVNRLWPKAEVRATEVKRGPILAQVPPRRKSQPHKLTVSQQSSFGIQMFITIFTRIRILSQTHRMCIVTPYVYRHGVNWPHNPVVCTSQPKCHLKLQTAPRKNKHTFSTKIPTGYVN